VTAFRRPRRATVLAAASLSLLLGACGGATATGGAQSPAASKHTLSGRIHIEGSSTVAPMTQVAARLFRTDNADVDFRIGSGGTSTGFAALCDHAADVAGASRHIKEAENTECMLREAVFEEFVVANDALTVVVNQANTWAACLTVEQLNVIWGPKSTAKSWKQVDPSFPDVPLALFGPGEESGTFDYFTQAVNDKEGASRTDYSASADDEDTAAGVAANVGGTGYFGYSYLDEHKDTMRAVDIDNGAGCVAPSVATAQDGSYAPLSRPLFLYPDAEQLRDRPEVKAFVEFYVEHHAEIAEAAGFVPLNAAQEEDLQDNLAKLKAY